MACTPKDLEKLSAIAKKEIKETGVNIDDAVKRVRELIAAKHEDLRLPPDADVLLERSLRCRKFDMGQAATQIHSFFKLLKDLYVMHKDMYFLPSLLQENFFECCGITVLKHRDARGRVVIMTDFERLPSETYNFDKGLAATILLMDELTRSSVETQRLGIVIICNSRGYNFQHAKQFGSLGRIRAITRMIQGAFPARFKELHCVRSPALFTYTYALAKPFLGEKMKKRVYFHGTDLTEFHRSFSPNILPKTFGGNLTNDESIDMDFTRRLVNKDNYYKELFQYGYMGRLNLEN